MIFIYIISVIFLVFFVFYKWLDSKVSSVFVSVKKGTSETPEDYKKVFEPVYFKSEDGIDLSGWFIPSSKNSDKTVIICHGINQNKSDLLKNTIFLSEMFNLFYFDFRAYGESKGNSTSFGIYETRDISGAVSFLKKFREDFSKQIFVYAPSFASITVSKFSDINQIDGAVIFNPVIDLRFFINQIAKKISIPFIPDFLIKKYIRTRNIDINKRISFFSMPVVVVFYKNESHIFDLISSAHKDKIEIEKDSDINNALKEAFIKLKKMLKIKNPPYKNI